MSCHVNGMRKRQIGAASSAGERPIHRFPAGLLRFCGGAGRCGASTETTTAALPRSTRWWRRARRSTGQGCCGDRPGSPQQLRHSRMGVESSASRGEDAEQGGVAPAQKRQWQHHPARRDGGDARGIAYRDAAATTRGVWAGAVRSRCRYPERPDSVYWGRELVIWG
jgi:hypothetical protein